MPIGTNPTREAKPVGWCRACDHCHWYDSTILKFANVYECSLIECKCMRKDWLPANNLEYLEYLYSKLEKKNETSR